MNFIRNHFGPNRRRCAKYFTFVFYSLRRCKPYRWQYCLSVSPGWTNVLSKISLTYSFCLILLALLSADVEGTSY